MFASFVCDVLQCSHSNNCIAILNVIKCCYIHCCKREHRTKSSASDERSVAIESTEGSREILSTTYAYCLYTHVVLCRQFLTLNQPCFIGIYTAL